MQPFGPTFKELRLEKRFSLKDTAEGIVSTQFLTNFESGKSDIKLTNFTLLLDRIHLTYEEFLYRYQDPSVVDLSKIFFQFHEVTSESNDRLRLKKLSNDYQKLYETHQSDTYLHASILCEAVGGRHKEKISDERKEILRQYLLKTEFWGKYEFFFFELLPSFFSAEELLSMQPRIIRDAKQFPKYYNVFDSEVILNITFDLIHENSIHEAKIYLDSFYNDFPEPNLDNFNFYALAEFLRGLILISQGDPSGEGLCHNYLNFMDTVPNFKITRNLLYDWIYRAHNNYDNSTK